MRLSQAQPVVGPGPGAAPPAASPPATAPVSTGAEVALGGGVSTTIGCPKDGGGGVRSDAGSVGGLVCFKRISSKLARPVLSMTVM